MEAHTSYIGLEIREKEGRVGFLRDRCALTRFPAHASEGPEHCEIPLCRFFVSNYIQFCTKQALKLITLWVAPEASA